MKTDSLAKAIRATKGLTTQELQELRKHISALLQIGPGPADRAVASLDIPEELHWIAGHLRDEGAPPVSATRMFQATQFGTFNKKLPELRQYLARAGDRNRQRALFRLGVKLLHKDLRGQRIAVSYLSLMNHVHRIPGVIDRMFPGYALNGLLPLIIREEKDHVRKEPSKRKLQRKRLAS